MTSSTLKERVQDTLKSEDTEGTFELYVTRTPGYLWALLFKKLHIHPIAVTLLSIVIGALAGYFFWWDDLYMNLIGMFLLIWANWYDCADGQLARMTGQKTLIGSVGATMGDMDLADGRFLRFPLPCQTMCRGRLLPQHPPLFPQRGIGKRIGQLCPTTRPDAIVTLEPQGMVSQDIPLFLWKLHAGTGAANAQIPKVLCPRPATLSGRGTANVERTIPYSEPSFDEIHEHPDFRYTGYRTVRIAVYRHALALLRFRDYRTRSLALLHPPCT